MNSENVAKYFNVTIEIGLPTEMGDFDFNDWDDPEEIQQILTKEYGGTDLEGFTKKLNESLGVGTDGGLDDPENLTDIDWTHATIRKVSIDPFICELGLLMSANVSANIADDDSAIENEIMHCFEIDSQMPKHNVTLNYFQQYDVEEISEQEFIKLRAEPWN